jgi:plasmid stabilization system protein ParE
MTSIGSSSTIARDSPERFAAKLVAQIDNLAYFPHAGAICPYHRKTRQLIHGNYIVYYTVHRTTVLIRAVVHGAQLFRRFWLHRNGE